MSSSPIIQARTSTWRLIAYSLASIPLAMAALPIYVNVPKFYADVIGVSLTAIGGLLLAARVFDAIQDPLLGYWSDRTRHTKWGRFVWVAAGAPLLAAAMLGLFNPPALSANLMMWWLVAMLLVVYTAFSMLQISYQAYGAEISDDPVERTRVVSFREGFGLIGVFLAAALPQILSSQYGPREGYAIFALIFIPFILVMVTLTVWLSPAPQIRIATVSKGAFSNMLLPLKNLRFKSLLLVFVFNGIAASIPATLVLFFIEDVIKAPAQAAVFLIAYFAAGAAGMPLWVWLSARIGKGRAWLVGMLVSIVAFVWAFMLGAGDVVAFGIICVLSGLGLGADLALPPSILADVIDDDERAGHGRNEGAYFGLWNLVTKMNLALAAGIALPALAMLGYVPQGANSGQSLTYLAAIYALLPCMLKAIAAAALLYSPFVRSAANTRGGIPLVQKANP
ncbi:MAG: MFS transporter [Burkholderiales bacterium]|jgi:GPH family glycoside/pentoside/hexuronide:cation symporter|nr:MFS transporter [Betaproteobacteria bacterium]